MSFTANPFFLPYKNIMNFILLTKTFFIYLGVAPV